jgi:hypothetical protein
MKAYGEWVFLTWALIGGEWWASRLDRFIPGERAHGTHWTGGWVGPKASLDVLEKIKMFYSGRESKPASPVRTLDAIPTELWGL